MKRVLEIEGDDNSAAIRTDCQPVDLSQCDVDGLETRFVDREINNDCFNGICPDDNEDDPDNINMASKCMKAMKQPVFGFRVLAKLIDDVDASCDDPLYKDRCNEAEANGRRVDCPERR